MMQSRRSKERDAEGRSSNLNQVDINDRSDDDNDSELEPEEVSPTNRVQNLSQTEPCVASVSVGENKSHSPRRIVSKSTPSSETALVPDRPIRLSRLNDNVGSDDRTKVESLRFQRSQLRSNTIPFSSISTGSRIRRSKESEALSGTETVACQELGANRVDSNGNAETEGNTSGSNAKMKAQPGNVGAFRAVGRAFGLRRDWGEQNSAIAEIERRRQQEFQFAERAAQVDRRLNDTHDVEEGQEESDNSGYNVTLSVSLNDIKIMNAKRFLWGIFFIGWLGGFGIIVAVVFAMDI